MLRIGYAGFAILLVFFGKRVATGAGIGWDYGREGKNALAMFGIFETAF
jgi:hypothetical protein